MAKRSTIPVPEAGDPVPLARATPPDQETVVFLRAYDAPGYGVYRRGDVASFEGVVARKVLADGAAVPFVEGMKLPEPEAASIMVGAKEIHGLR